MHTGKKESREAELDAGCALQMHLALCSNAALRRPACHFTPPPTPAQRNSRQKRKCEASGCAGQHELLRRGVVQPHGCTSRVARSSGTWDGPWPASVLRPQPRWHCSACTRLLSTASKHAVLTWDAVQHMCCRYNMHIQVRRTVRTLTWHKRLNHVQCMRNTHYRRTDPGSLDNLCPVFIRKQSQEDMPRGMQTVPAAPEQRQRPQPGT